MLWQFRKQRLKLGLFNLRDLICLNNKKASKVSLKGEETENERLSPLQSSVLGPYLLFICTHHLGNLIQSPGFEYHLETENRFTQLQPVPPTTESYVPLPTYYPHLKVYWECPLSANPALLQSFLSR